MAVTHLGLFHVVHFLRNCQFQILDRCWVHHCHIYTTNTTEVNPIEHKLRKGVGWRATVVSRVSVSPNEVPSNLRTEIRMALPSSRLMRVSTSAKFGFFGTSASMGSSSRVVSTDCSFAFFTLLLLYSAISSQTFQHSKCLHET